MPDPVAVLLPQTVDNLGNDWIAQGCTALLDEVVPPAGAVRVRLGRAADPALPPLPRSVAAAVDRSCSAVVVPCGSLVHTGAGGIVDLLASFTVPVHLLGLGFAGYVPEEGGVAARLTALARTVVWRDATSRALGAELGTPGAEDRDALLPDLALFAPLPTPVLPGRGGHVVWVVDSDHDEDAARAARDALLADPAGGSVVVTSQDCAWEPHPGPYLTDLPAPVEVTALALGEPDAVLHLLAGARLVVTSRIHVVFLAARLGVPCHFVGRDADHPNGRRSLLFSRLGLALRTGEVLAGVADRLAALAAVERPAYTALLADRLR
ncbi:polysaccharide pyruvyl transferase family protein [Cellulomonas marina]|uniref:Polysaccharide pyruvyl transferase n=1 Tax=Cellulomonas marina TaxID=988821 RepID=A0A1I0UZD7_9CELL|nr:polysaccharide pyruvyl transferase family protein [Cellulomonas marina]GIG29911.1 hypothetical protein Cma02nite_25110 [Cellulomonas marina]SFA69220.1 Polysaccharide pyruvyl transferase [Cellulomonas marina]